MWRTRANLLRRTAPLFFPPKSVNSVTLIGVAHDIQSGYVFEDTVTQFLLTTTSIDTTNASQECVVEKDHHTVRCFGDAFAAEVKSKIKEGNVVAVNGRLRLNPQLEPSANKYFYFPYIHVQSPYGSVSVVHGDRRKGATINEAPVGTIEGSAEAPKPAEEAATDSNDNNKNTSSSDEATTPQ